MNNNTYELIAPCHFGMEAVLKREILDLGYETVAVDNGKVTFRADAEGICRANIFLRTTERILLKVAEFKAFTFDELFENIKALPWDRYIPKDGKFWVAKASSVNSQLFSPSDIQRIVKKAMVESLKRTYHQEWFKEDGAEYPLRISILKNVVTVGLDTTGISLHKRGYRKYTAPAPVTETLAAAILLLSPWKKDRILVDPFCGSGTTLVAAKLTGRKFIGIDTNADAIKLCQERISNPIKTESILLKTGIIPYQTKTSDELAILSQFECDIVQRNKGIDAFLKKYYLGAPVAIKIQKQTESIQDAISLLHTAGAKKRCSFTILIRQNTDMTLFDTTIPPNMIVIDSNRLEVEQNLERRIRCS